MLSVYTHPAQSKCRVLDFQCGFTIFMLQASQITFYDVYQIYLLPNALNCLTESLDYKLAVLKQTNT